MARIGLRLTDQQKADLLMLARSQSLTITGLIEQWLRRALAHFGHHSKAGSRPANFSKKERTKERKSVLLQENTPNPTTTTQEESLLFSLNNTKSEAPQNGSADAERKRLVAELITRVHAYYCTKMERDPNLYRLTPQRRQKLAGRVEELRRMVSADLPGGERLRRVEQLMQCAIDGCAASDFHMGREDKTSGKQFNDLTQNIFRSYEQMEKWLNATTE